MNIKSRIKRNISKHFVWNGVEVHIKEAFLEQDISIKNILKTVETHVPKHLLRGLETIYIGEFDFLKKRDLEAGYENGGIFLSNEKSSEEDCVDDIIHEIAHLVEQEYAELIYSDGNIEKEFLN